MAFSTGLPKVRDHREHFNERTWMCYHQVPPLGRVVAHVGDAGQAKPQLEHNPLSLLGTCHAMPLRKLNDPVPLQVILSVPISREAPCPRILVSSYSAASIARLASRHASRPLSTIHVIPPTSITHCVTSWPNVSI